VLRAYEGPEKSKRGSYRQPNSLTSRLPRLPVFGLISVTYGPFRAIFNAGEQQNGVTLKDITTPKESDLGQAGVQRRQIYPQICILSASPIAIDRLTKALEIGSSSTADPLPETGGAQVHAAESRQPIPLATHSP